MNNMNDYTLRMTSHMILNLVKDARKNIQGATAMLLLLRESGVLDMSTEIFPDLLSNISSSPCVSICSCMNLSSMQLMQIRRLLISFAALHIIRTALINHQVDKSLK